jgi:purine-binding chemotaxis protein CheW
MRDCEEIKLPASGLAEDVLAQFVEKAQEEINAKSVAPGKNDGETILHLVTFNLGREEYGVDINNVQEIIRATDITTVPGAPDHVCGVINLRGKIIPVVGLRKRFGLADVAASDEQRIVVVELGEKRLGMQVDSVSQVIKLSSTIIEEMPEEAITLGQNYIRGVGKLEGRLVIILDLHCALLYKDAV